MAQDPQHESYLGDGVYVCVENGMIRLTTGHHQEGKADNVIWLELDVAKNLLDYVQRHLSEIQ